MVKALRLIKIKELLSKEGIVSTTRLSEVCGVSIVTIRNDLIGLEKEGFLRRTHGGAVLTQQPESVEVTKVSIASEPDIARQNMLAEIGRMAESYINPSNWALLGYGSTCREIAYHLLNKQLKIVTGNIDAAVILSQSKTVEVFIPGGYLGKKSNYLLLGGEWYQKGLNMLNFDQAFISVAGIDESGFTVDDASECQTLALIRKIAREVIIVSTADKFGKTSFYRISGLNFADVVITNDSIPDMYADILSGNNIRLITPSRYF